MVPKERRVLRTPPSLLLVKMRCSEFSENSFFRLLLSCEALSSFFPMFGGSSGSNRKFYEFIYVYIVKSKSVPHSLHHSSARHICRFSMQLELHRNDFESSNGPLQFEFLIKSWKLTCMSWRRPCSLRRSSRRGTASKIALPRLR